jgi:hypothetical protein
MKTQSVVQSGHKNGPITLIFSDNEDGTRAACEAVLTAGGRIGASTSIAEASQRLAHQVVADTIFIDIAHCNRPIIDKLFGDIDRWCDGAPVPAIICVPIEIIDLVADRIDDDRVTLLCEPSAVDRVSAITTSWMRQEMVLNDISTDLDGNRVKRIADEVSRLSRNLSRLVAGSITSLDSTTDLDENGRLKGVRLDFLSEPMASANAPAIDAGEVRAMLRLRRLRNNYFSSELFADPAWDMLLDLTAAQLEGEKVAVSSLCIAAAVPATTALRWIKTMCDAKLFERHADPLDGRRIFIGLSSGASQAMQAYLGAAKRAGGLTI